MNNREHKQKSALSTILFLIFSCCATSEIIAQCPVAPMDAACFDGIATDAFANFSNVVISEISGDAGQSDGCNDAIVEIAGPPETIIGCMVITNTEWAVLIPPGTEIPADGVYVIACGDGGPASCGVGIVGGSNGLLADGTEGDFNPGLPIDFDVCDPANASFYYDGASGFTLDNAGIQSQTGDGDQVFLFLPDGTQWDGIYWDMGATGGNDHVSVSVNGNDYTLGDNDGNGIVNDIAGTVNMGRGDGGNATAIKILPTDMACPCNTPTNPGTFTVPAIGGVSDDNGNGGPLWTEWTLSDHVGCNSSFIRLDPGTTAGGIGGTPSHMDGQVDDATVSTCGNNLDNGSGEGVDGDFGETTITSEGFTPSNFTPSACGAAIAEWAYTDHPTPGEPNDDPTFVFYVDVDELCEPGDVIFTVEVYNWQHVEELNMSSQQGNNRTGSYVFDPITGNNENWATYVVAGEITTMTYTASLTAAGTYNFGLVWDDWTDCCGTPGNPHTQSVINECYEVEMFTIKVAEPLAYDCDGDEVADDPQVACVISCDPAPPAPGAINANDYFIGGTGNLTFTLTDLSGTNAAQINTTGIFLIPTDGTANSGYTITITDLGTCGFEPLVITIDDNCELPPVCPENFVFTVDGGAGPVAACPGDMLEFCFSGDMLPAGGAINIQADLDGDTVFETTVCTEAVPEDPCPDAGANVIITEMSDPSSGWQTDRFAEICNSGPCDQDLTGWFVEIIGNNSADRTVNLSGTLASGQCAVIAQSDNNLTIAAGSLVFTWTGTPGNYNGQSRDGVVLNSGTGVVDVAVINESDNENWFENNRAERLPTACTPTGDTGNGTGAGSTLCADPIDNCALLTSNWNTTAGGAPTPGTHTFSGACDNSMMMAGSEVCCTFEIPSDACTSSTYTFRAEVDPFDTDNCPDDVLIDEADAFSDEISVTVSCPDASIIAFEFLGCTSDYPAGVDIPVTITGGTGPNYTVTYAINGTAQPAVVLANGANINISVPTTGKITVTLIAVEDLAGSMCIGTVNDAEVCIDVLDPSTALVDGATDATTCDPCDGTVTFSFTNIPSSGLEYEYTIDGNGPFAGVATSSPITLTGQCPGVYVLTTVEGICLGAVSGMATINAPIASQAIVVTTQPEAVCNTGDYDFDLTTVNMTPSYSVTTHQFYSIDPLTLSAASRTPFLLASTTITGITMSQSVWVLYTDPVTGCESSAEIMIVADVSGCPICPTLGVLIDPADVCEGADLELVIDGLANMAFIDNGDQDYGIAFVQYGIGNPAPADGTAAYTTGTQLGNVTYGCLTGVDPAQIATLIDNTLTEGVYQICAILSPTPGAPPNDDPLVCRPFVCIEVEVFVNPMTAIVMPAEACAGEAITITGTPTGGSTPYTHNWSITDDGGAVGILIVDNADGTASINAAGVTALGCFTVTIEYFVTDDNGCSSEPATSTLNFCQASCGEFAWDGQ